MIFSEIQFVFFDLGKVIVDFSHQREVENLSALAGVAPDKMEGILFDSGLQREFELGEIDKQQFTDAINNELGTKLPTESICLAISDIFQLKPSILPVLVQLVAARVPVGILSNTCVAHWEFILRRFPIVDLMIPDCHRVLSFECSSMKPDRQIYEKAVCNAGIPAENIFFMDDRLDNVRGARDAGMQAELFVNPQQIVRCLVERGMQINL